MTRVLRLALAAVLSSALASAALVTFSASDVGANSTDPRPNSNAAAASFDAAAALVGSVSTITFESSSLGSFTTLGVAPGVSIGSNQTIVNSPVGTPDRLFGYNTTPSGSQWLSLFGGSITFTFSTPTRAFGAYISGLQVDGETITFNDGSPQSVAIPNPGSGIAFVGFIDDVGVSSITINALNDIVGVDDVRYLSGASTAVPEPASVLLMGTALLGLLVWKK